MSFAGYSIRQLLRSSASTQVYEAERKRDGRRVIAKCFEVVEPGIVARIEHEFARLEGLDIPGVARLLGVERSGAQVVLVRDYIDGVTLADQAKDGALELGRFLAVARALARILADAHARGVVHRDIKPSNVLIERGTEAVFLADFGISVLLERERAHIHDPTILSGTLPYISPEQTGRTRREVDQRSDLYSLGVTFYELVTGRRPFVGAAPLELVHAHLAKRPIPPRDIDGTIPTAISRIIMRLLEKPPERRYQSAAGLLHDLDRVAEALAHERRPLESEPESESESDSESESESESESKSEFESEFESKSESESESKSKSDSAFDVDFGLGERDFSLELQLPHQLYGRDRERSVLSEQFERTLAQRSRRLVLVRGAPGLGKSALVRGFELALVDHHGYMAVGSFDQHHSELPYNAFARAFSSLVEQWLSEPDDRLARWRTDLSEALGPLAAVVVALIPDLGLVLREIPPLASVELGEGRNRVHLAITRLLNAIARIGPLVLVLEDLQWADGGSLELLRALLVDPEGPILVVATSRPEPELDLGRGSEGIATLDRATIIELEPLSKPALAQLLADVLRRQPDEVSALAEVVGRKTGSNPLFIRQFLIQLRELGLLAPSPSGWTWETEAIMAAPIPDDLLGLMTAKLAGIESEPLLVLQTAAAFGASFEGRLLEQLVDLDAKDLAGHLYTLEQEGLISPWLGGYQFSHDRLVEAALELLPIARRRSLHWRIGGLLRAEAEVRGEALGFAVIDQLDAGLGDIAELSDSERLSLARLNRDAGEQTLATGAWDVARRYFEAAVELVAPDLDDARRGVGERALVFAVHFGLAQATTLAAEMELASRAFDELSRWQLSLVEHGQLVGRRVRIAALQHRLSEALELGLAGLAKCGYPVPRAPSNAVLVKQVTSAWLGVRRVDRAALLALPDAHDERALAAMHIITAMKVPAFILAPGLHGLLTALHASLVLRHGFHEAAPEAIAQLAILIAAMGQPQRAAELCSDAMALTAARPTSVGTILRTEAIALLFVGPTHMPFRACAEPTEAGCRRSIEAGERENAGYFGAVGLALHLEAGTHLHELPELGARMRRENEDWGSSEMAVLAQLVLRFAATLALGDAEATIDPPATFMTQAEILDPEVSQLSRDTCMVVELAGRLILALCDETIEDELDSLWGLAESLAGRRAMLLSSWHSARFAALQSVLAVELAARGRASTRATIKLCRQNHEDLVRLAAGCEANFGPLARIAEAELERARGRVSAALSCYEAARELAADHGLRYAAGLAALRIAALGDQAGWELTSTGARSLAYSNFRGWGAWTLLDRLERAHVQLRAHGPTDDPSTRSPSTTPGAMGHLDELPGSASHSTSDLDLATVLGTMQLISADLRLDEVVSRVLAAAIENAGADRGALLLERDGQIALVARGLAGESPEFLSEPIPLRNADAELPGSVIRYVLRTGTAAVIDDLTSDPRFASDPYVIATGARSLLCMPMTKQRARVGALVLENRLAPAAFGPERLEVLGLLVAQAASALDNARLYAALARSEAQWRSLVDGAPDIITVLDARGRIEFINHFQPFELDAASLSGQPIERTLDAASLPAWRQAFAEALVGRAQELEISVAPRPGAPAILDATLTTGVLTRTGASPTRRWYSVRLAPLEVRGAARGSTDAKVLAIATDVTEHKRLEAQLRQQQRLKSIGTLASGVAHEINNPIQGILNYAELMGSRAEDPGTVVEFAAEITHESQRVATIVRNLLAFSRQERDQEFETIEVRAVLDATLSLLRAVLRKDHVEVAVELGEAVPAIECRPQQIQQVVMNLVTNARDALNQRYAGFDPNKRIEVQVTTPDPRRVRISVSDRGLGIPEEVSAHIFDPFFTTKGRDQGTGLGLSVSHGIIADHGGELTVESQVGVGSTFHLDLPVRRG